MVQAVWTGGISFGLVHIPVRLYPATEPKDVRFHLYDRRTGKRVRYERVTRDEDVPAFAPGPEPSARERPATPDRFELPPSRAAGPSRDEAVEDQDIVRGVELPGGDLVTVTASELVSLAPERSRTIDIEEFVDLAQVDPVFFEKSYHVAPARGVGAEKPYTLLLRAMQAAGMAGIGRFVLRTRPHLVAIRPLESSIALETLFFADEVRAPEAAGQGLTDPEISERELKTARQLITAMTTDWVPERHGDAYREELLKLLRSKRAERPPEVVESRDVARVADLMDALRASVEAAKRKRPSKAAASKRAG